MEQRAVTFESDDLTLEGVVEIPKGKKPLPGVVLCHPHPVHGGDMSNNVVAAMAHAISKEGIATLRFNFRGVGQSQGEFSRGAGELGDALAALTFLSLEEEVDASRIGIAGYSFGAGIALEASWDNALVQAMASIACPTPTLNDLSLHQLVVPKLLICGDMDHVVPGDQFRFLTGRFLEPKEVHLLSGADHFFRGHEPEIAEKTGSFFRRWLLR